MTLVTISLIFLEVVILLFLLQLLWDFIGYIPTVNPFNLSKVLTLIFLGLLLASGIVVSVSELFQILFPSHYSLI